ncbi:MAG: coproporphyrinogen III oxidase [Desulfuromonas sp.]|nr:MAG: coproporphyrinogen III oxidase [Desulfuromonas sp.]
MASLYLHIPFCSNKCPYCDFYSQVATAGEIDRYAELLCRDISQLKRCRPLTPPLETIYFGGGTPSLLSPPQIEAILASCATAFGLAPGCEITLEANPGTLADGQLEACRAAGINRLSLGIQSLDEKNLRQLGRIHNVGQARESVNAARRTGFSNLSLDLMFALPEQSLSDLDRELVQLLELDPEHISIYGLSFEDGTEFAARLARGELMACDESLYAEQYRLINERLRAAGFEHYEISNFARPGRRCRHNQTYWQRNSCLAAGAGAHGFDASSWGERWHIPPDLKRYAERIEAGANPAEFLESFTHHSAMAEYLYLSLRTADGLDLERFAERFGCRAEQVFATAREKATPYLQINAEHWFFTPEGWLLYDHLISHFL